MTSGTTGRPLAAVIATVLAVTAGATLTVTPVAIAAPAATATVTGTVAPASATDIRAGYKVPADVSVLSSGPSGFLGSTTRHVDEFFYDYRWYRPDGTSTSLGGAYSDHPVQANLVFSDIVTRFKANHRVIELLDMSAPAGTPPVVIDLDTRGSGYRYVATIGSTVLVEVETTNGQREFHLLSKSGTTVTERTITGVPATFKSVLSVTGAPGTALVRYQSTEDVHPYEYGLFAIDLAAGAVTRTYPPLAYGEDAYQHGAASPTKLAVWQGENLVVTDRASGTDTSVTVGRPASDTYPALGLLGDWVAYGTYASRYRPRPDGPLTPFTARSLKDGRTVKLLDRTMSGVTPGPDGSLLVQGSTAEKGEGAYRIALGADGVPTTELVVSTGTSTQLALLSTDIAPVNDLDTQDKRLHLDWLLSRRDFSYTLKLIHKQSGRQFVHTGRGEGYGEIPFSWDAASAPAGSMLSKDPFNGDYTWDLTAKPDNGIGEDVHATGEFKVVRKPKMHDFDDNGSPDLLARDSQGYLHHLDTTYDAETRRVVPTGQLSPIGSGWNGYKLIESVGDIAGTTAPDVVGRDTAGVLWLHQGTGNESKPLADRVRIGAGWNIYTQLAAGSDVTGDGRADILATDTAGVMWLYKGTGKPSAPLANRIKVGAGWNIYNQISAVGDLAGATAGDLVARDKAGVLWLYLGKGNGTFATRVRIGAGWSQYSQIVGIGDATKDGRADLYAYGPNNTSYIYSGTGSWSMPLRGRVPTDLLVVNGDGYELLINHVT